MKNKKHALLNEACKRESGVMPPRLSAKTIINIYNSFGILSADMFKKRFDD